MEWLGIIRMIIAILTTVLQFLGGGSPLFPMTSNVYQLSDNQWQCGDVYWSMPAQVKDKHFTGTVALDCNVEGLTGGGLTELETHLLDRLPVIAREIHLGPVDEYLGWLPSTYHEISYDIETDDGTVEVRGESHVATDRYSELRSLFRSVEIERSNGAEYLKRFIDELNVAPSGNGWYSVQLRSGSRVEKPRGMSDKAFRDEVTRQLEERIEQRRKPVLNDVANHL